MVESDELTAANVAGPELLLGDIVLARGVCEAEAADKGVSVEQHATHLLVHGTLHLLGYDHHEDEEAADMEAREVRALARLGIANPYEVAA
jgi:probable rRNA maturation factor